ncbi:uncharacterized protein [Palaemon carinicauda]|uniref:uncharacterized protein isoform X2 n=1 Tax=Palaemon carinicauda TaxID=392227 RepID=UPI0035B5F730
MLATLVLTSRCGWRYPDTHTTAREKIVQLIECYRGYPLLWDPTHKLYKRWFKRADAWREIAENIQMERNEVEKKMKNLVTQFQRELKKCQEKNSGDGAEDAYNSEWFAFSIMLFLPDKHKPHKTYDVGYQVFVRFLCRHALPREKVLFLISRQQRTDVRMTDPVNTYYLKYRPLYARAFWFLSLNYKTKTRNPGQFEDSRKNLNIHGEGESSFKHNVDYLKMQE